MNLPRDAAQADFWDARYREGITPWESGAAPAELREAAARWSATRAGMPAAVRVLVPGCGSAHDVALLEGAGLDVLGIDFSSAAVQAALAVTPKVAQADFFGFAQAEGGYDVVYERAFLCALPRRLWPAWGARVAMLVRPGGLLEGYFFLADTPRGPPFGILREALYALLDPAFALEADEAPQASLPVFEGRERWMRWRRRAA